MLPSAQRHLINQTPHYWGIPWGLSGIFREPFWDKQERDLAEPMSWDCSLDPGILMAAASESSEVLQLLQLLPKTPANPVWAEQGAPGTLCAALSASPASTLWLPAQAKQEQLWMHSKQLAFRKGFCHQFCLSYKVRKSLDTLPMSLC